jgi:hypothetical protein
VEYSNAASFLYALQLDDAGKAEAINMNYSNAWEVVLLATVSATSNPHFGKDLQARLGVHTKNEVQQVTRERRKNRKGKDRARHQSEPAKKRTRNHKKRLKQ